MSEETTLPDGDIWPQFMYEAIKPDGWRTKGVPKPFACYSLKTIDRIKGREIFVKLTETWAEQLKEGPSLRDYDDPGLSDA